MEATENTELSTKVEQSDSNDPYAYLNRDEFSSENFKIEIRDLPKYYGISEMKKLLNDKLKLDCSKIKAPRKGSSWVYICFRREDDRVRAVDILNGYKWKGKILRASVAKPMADPLVRKRKENIDSAPEHVTDKEVEVKSQDERLKENIIPFWNIPYDEQLSIKQKRIQAVLIKLRNQLLHVNPDLKSFFDASAEKNDGLPCELWNIKKAERIDGYRNKCEFTVGLDEQTGQRTVGFRLGRYTAGSTAVAPVNCLLHIPEKMKLVAKLFESFVRETKDLDVFDPELQTGHFKQLTVRLAAVDTGDEQLMLIVGINPQHLSTERLEQLKTDLVSFFTEGNGKKAVVSSLYCQLMIKRSPGSEPTPPIHLYGDTHIYEKLLGLRFRISPQAFFQINTQAASVLYSTAIEIAKPKPTTTVVDICCGTGTIGLCFAKSCSQILGLEVVPQAINDARQNALDNNVDNCEFFVGRAEDILSSVMSRARTDDVVAIVDPPRAGLHQRAIQQLRKCERLNKLVYVSCDAASALKNFVDLGRRESKSLHGNPLVPIRAVVVDMFPHTAHCELLIYFERRP